MTNFAIGGLAPAFYVLSTEFDKTMGEVSHLLLYPILVLGVFNFFWVPIANYVGKRPVFVVGSALLCCCCVWGAVARSFTSLLWSNIISAFAGSLTETLGAAMVNVRFWILFKLRQIIRLLILTLIPSRTCSSCMSEVPKWVYMCKRTFYTFSQPWQSI